MRITIHLNDQLHAELKQWAAQSGRTLTAVIEDALREALARHQQRLPKAVKLITDHGSGLRPGLNLDNSAELLDLMEGPDGPE
jgi:hypothetical protein